MTNKVVEEFVNEFHNLEGVTVAEKRRNLFRLFHKNSSFSENTTLLNSITSHLVAKTHLEKLFRVEFLIYFRQHEELLKEFLKGDDITVSKVAKQTWFFERAFKTVGAQFVHEIIPSLSVSMRLKILKKLVLILEEGQCDEIFDALLDRYGVFVASNILMNCSSGKIEQILRNYPVKLWTSQLKLLYKKNPELIYVYFEEEQKHTGCIPSDSIFSFIAEKDPKMFCDLQEKYKMIYCHLGKRTTKKLIKTNKDRILANPELYSQNLNAAKFVRTLGSDFKQVCFKFFPKNVNSVLRLSILFKYYPKKGQFALFKDTFNQVFYKKLEDKHDLISESLLDMITDSEEREHWAKMKFEKDENDSYLKYFKTENCFRIIQERMDVSSELTKRIENISLMTQSSLINKDWDSLLKVCELLCNRFKNDDKGIYLKFLEIITTKKYNYLFNNLQENHWEYIKKIICRRECKIEKHFDTTSLVLKYCEFLHSTERLITENEIRSLIQESNWLKFLNNLHESNPRSKTTVLKIFINLAPHLIQESDKIEKVDCQLILACKKHNEDHCSEKINIFEFPRLLESVREAFNKRNIVEEHTLSCVLGWILCTGDQNEFVQELTELYWNNFEHYPNISIIQWFLKHRPVVIQNHINNFCQAIFSDDATTMFGFYERKDLILVWKIIKCYTHLELDQKLIEYCTNKLKEEDFDNKNDLIEPLLIIMEPTDFAKLTEAYIPTSSTVDILDEEKSNLFQFQRNLLKSFVHTNLPEVAISIIMRFCSGDYVTSCISPLYSCLYRIPENRIEPYLDRLCKTGAVSIKKHGFYFACVVKDEASILNFLKTCHLSQAIAMSYQHFVKNPSQLSWDVFKSKLVKLDKNDHFTSLLLVNTPAPKKYKTVYFTSTFEVFQRQNNKFTKVLLDKVQKETVAELQPQFFQTIKDQFLMTDRSELIFGYYLFCSKNEERFDVIFDALRTFKQKYWSFTDHEAREKLYKFTVTLFKIYLELERKDEALIDNFLKGFNDIFSPVEVFEEYIIISLMKFKDQSVEEFSNSILGFNDYLTEHYGTLTLKILADCLNKVLLPNLYKTEADIFKFYDSLFERNRNINDLLFVLELLPHNEPDLKLCAQYYHKIINLLKNIDNDTIQVHLNLLLK